jgi:hypothetical protein
MASQSGQNYVINYKVQSVIGTPVTGTGGYTLRTLASQGFDYQRARIQSQEIRSDGFYGKPRKGVKSAPGSYLCELSYNTFNPLYEAFLRGTFDSVGVLVPGSTRKFFTFEQYHQDVDLSLQVETVRPVSMSVTIPAEGMAQIQWGLMGRNMAALDSASSVSITSPTLTTTNPIAGIDCSITGPASMQFSSVQFSCTRPGGVQALIGTSLSPDVYDGSATGEGTISGTLETLAYLSEVAGDTSTTLTVTCPDDAGNEIEFALSGVQLENFSAPVGQPNALIVSSRFSFGGTTALQITNTDA